MLCSRMGDTGQGTCHAGGDGSHSATGTIISGASISLVGGSLMARMNDMLISDCHSAVGMIIAGSGTVFVEGLPAARVGDTFHGTFEGRLVSGAGNVLIGG